MSQCALLCFLEEWLWEVRIQGVGIVFGWTPSKFSLLLVFFYNLTNPSFDGDINGVSQDISLLFNLHVGNKFKLNPKQMIGEAQ